MPYLQSVLPATITDSNSARIGAVANMLVRGMQGIGFEPI